MHKTIILQLLKLQYYYLYYFLLIRFFSNSSTAFLVIIPPIGPPVAPFSLEGLVPLYFSSKCMPNSLANSVFIRSRASFASGTNGLLLVIISPPHTYSFRLL